ncbi:MAG: 50S ribosomal protein L13 [Desulfurococcaceae archaeon]
MGEAGDVIYVDADGQILGRMASKVAKLLLEGRRVVIVNAEKAVLSGPRRRVVEGYKLLLSVRTHRNPEKSGIRRPRSPINIVRRAVRGMLPMDRPKGREAFGRLRVYVGLPDAFKDKQLVKFEEADAGRLKGKYTTVGEVARELGWSA